LARRTWHARHGNRHINPELCNGMHRIFADINNRVHAAGTN